MIDDAFSRVFAAEQLSNARGISVFRFLGVSGMLAVLTAFQLADPDLINVRFGLLIPYWVVAAVVMAVSLRSQRGARACRSSPRARACRSW